VSANDLTPEEHVKVQAVAQGYIDSSISKTVNAPKTHTVADVERLYMMAYDMGLKELLTCATAVGRAFWKELKRKRRKTGSSNSANRLTNLAKTKYG